MVELDNPDSFFRWLSRLPASGLTPSFSYRLLSTSRRSSSPFKSRLPVEIIAKVNFFKFHFWFCSRGRSCARSLKLKCTRSWRRLQILWSRTWFLAQSWIQRVACTVHKEHRLLETAGIRARSVLHCLSEWCQYSVGTYTDPMCGRRWE